MTPVRLFHLEDLVLLRAAELIEQRGYDRRVHYGWDAESGGPLGLNAAIETAEQEHEQSSPVPGVSERCSPACRLWEASGQALLIRHVYEIVWKPQWTAEVLRCRTCVVCQEHRGDVLAMFDNACHSGCDSECPGFQAGGHHSASDFMHPLHMASEYGLDEVIQAIAEFQPIESALPAIELLRAAARSR